MLSVAVVGTRRKKLTKDAEIIDSVHLYPTDGTEYTADLLAGLSAASLPTLSSSQLTSLLSDIDPQPKLSSGHGSERGTPCGKEKESAEPSSNPNCMEKNEISGQTWYSCSLCEHLCLTSEEAGSHLTNCSGTPLKVKCIACENTFKSTAVLKAHLLIDHSVSVNEHSAFIRLNLGMRTETNCEHLDTASQTDGVTTEQVAAPISEESSVPKPAGFFNSCESLLNEGNNSAEKIAAIQEDVTTESSSDKDCVKLEKSTKIKCGVEGCTVKLSSASNMDYHQLCHTKEGGWRCPECGSTSETSWRSLSLHLWRGHSLDMGLYSCSQCPYRTYSLSKLMNLHRRTHSSERPFLCDLCGKGFKTTKQLRNHKTVHRKGKEKIREDEEGNQFECATCGRKFASARLLRQHADIVHRKLRPYLCPDCGHSAGSRSSLRMHVRQHTGEKPYSCEDCDFTTGDHNTLRRHKMRHSGAKPYTCPHCPYACIQSSTFKAHLNTKHPGLEKGLMYSCEVCPFRTVKRDNYLAHVSLHSLVPIDGELGSISLLQSPSNEEIE